MPVSIIEVIKSAHTLPRATKGYSRTAVKSRTIAERCSAVYIVAASQTSVSRGRRDTQESRGSYSSEISKASLAGAAGTIGGLEDKRRCICKHFLLHSPRFVEGLLRVLF